METVALARMLARYWVTVAPRVRRELGQWEARARLIPDAALRALAVDKLHDERLNAEAAATFATLVAWRRRSTAVRLTVAYQVLYDYLDGVNEHPAPDQIRDGRQLHRALSAALDPDAGHIDYYRHHPRRDDGGYLESLVEACRSLLHGLPSAAAVLPVALRAAGRCGEGQSRTHAVASDGPAQLAAWSAAQAPESGLEWWELAAGAVSPLSVHGLFAAAADPRTTADRASAIEAVYYPPICALSTLLDSLIDYAGDGPAEQHRYVAYYRDERVAAERLGRIASRAATAARALPRGSWHAVIVAGIAGFYLSTREAAGDFPRPAARRVVADLGSVTGPTLGVLRLRRACRGRRRA